MVEYLFLYIYGVAVKVGSESEESEVSISSDSAYDSVAHDLVKNKIVGVGRSGRRINQSQCTFPCFVIGLVLPFLLVTPTT